MEHITYLLLILVTGFLCYKSGHRFGQNKMAKQVKEIFEQEKKKHQNIIDRKNKYGR